MKLYGFNNLTKTLSFNFYDICYAKEQEQREKYIEYIDEEYNSERLVNILTEVSDLIGATVLNIAHQDYDPQGASVTMLVAEEHMVVETKHDQAVNEDDGDNDVDYTDSNDSNDMREGDTSTFVAASESVVGHLDKSHITVHTYPEYHPDSGISTFRADIDVSTCGEISPLKALNLLMTSFEPDIAYIDYRVRGFTRDVNGGKHFIDHKINSIQNFIASKTRESYDLIDVNVYQENIFHTKMILREFDLNRYLFGTDKKELLPRERNKIKQRIKKEMLEIFYGRNLN